MTKLPWYMKEVRKDSQIGIQFHWLYVFYVLVRVIFRKLFKKNANPNL